MSPREPSPALVATLVLTLVWVWAEECLGGAPNQDTLQVNGISFGRRKREPECQQGEYLHPNNTHCCMRCHAGTYLAEHCQLGSLAPRCLPCPAGTYTAVNNFADKCRSCRRCRSEFQQVTLENCTESKNTVCGCLANQYQTSESDFFQCRNCSLCHNGGVRHACTKNRDTVCECYHGFFHQKNTCKPCSSCSKEECKFCGPLPGPTTSSSVKEDHWEKQGQVLLLISLVVVLTMSLGVLLVVKLIKLCRQKGPTPIFYSCVSTQQPKSKPVPEVSKAGMNEKKAAIHGPQSPQIEAMWAVNAVPSSLVAQELPDCVRPAGKTQLPDNPAVLYTVADHVLPSRWKEFVRRLGLSDYEIERIELEQRRLRDAQYEMLRQWRLQMGRGATVERISFVLNQMELSGCSEAIQEALSRQA
ncbi:tumor necrosis factor receptor superfamily member 1A isoform X2 [Carettochelys insculpta]|uniref:tumor necrosis factor receptor superfamily member 1A isoform X2 n=1 Tax=Carettochelys insculpta TaxID=44489 RepID=UPI003EBB1C49